MDSELIVRLRSCYDKVKAEENPAGGIKVSRKDNQVTEKHLAQGDQFFSKVFFIDAIDKYNESLCYAQADAENPFKLNEIYMNRAFALFRMDLPRECLESIRLAESGQYPEHLRERLTKLTKRCEEKIKLLGEEPEKFRLALSYRWHEKIPFMVKCLELRTTEEFGRHIVTNRYLKVGDVVMIETPFVAFLKRDELHKRCTNCMAGDKRHALIPCPTCTRAMFCSNECQKAAWNKFHRFECKIAASVPEDGFLRLALRSLFIGISTYGGIDKFQKYLKDNQEMKPNAFDLDFNNRDPKLEFLALHHLHSDDSHFPDSNKNTFYTDTAISTYLLVMAKVFPESDRDFMLTTIHRYIISAAINCFGTSKQLPPDFDRERLFQHQQLAMALINHSCVPNVTRLQQDNKQVLMVVRPIQKGGLLVDSYRKAYYGTPKAQRQIFYKLAYGFLCKCEACEKDYPTREGLCAKKLPKLKGIGEYKRRHGDNQEARLKYAESVAKYMRENDHDYPCVQLHYADTELETTYRRILDKDLWEQQEKLLKYKEVKRGLSESDCARNLM